MNKVPDLSNPKKKQFSAQALPNYVEAYNHMTGELPKEIRVSEDFLDWYAEQLKASGKELGFYKALNINESIKIDKERLEFSGIKLVTK